MLGRPKRATARPKPPLIAATALAAASLVAGCKGSDTPSPAAAASSPPPPSAVTTATTASPGTTPTTKAPTEEDRVVDAYRQLWVEIVAANNPPNPDSPGLSRVATGEMLEKARDSANQNKTAGNGLRQAEPSHFAISPESVSVSGNEASLIVCLTDDIQQFRLADGVLLNGNSVTHRVNVALRREGGVWKTYKNDFPQKNGEPEPCA